MQQALLGIQILVAVALIGLILLQHGKGADAGAAFGSGTSGSIFGARGPASFLAKITALLAAVFFFNSMALSYLAGKSVERASVVERFQEAPPAAPAEPPSAIEQIPGPPSAPPATDSGPAAPAGQAPADVPAAPGGQ